jgi:uncharacterized delta-60 repeat protein
MLKFNIRFRLIFTFLFVLFPVSVYSAGVLDQTFGTNGRADFGGNNSYSGGKVLVQPDDKIVVGSVGFPDGSANSQITVARFNADGSIDTTFGNNGYSSVGSKVSLGDMKLQPDGKIVVVGKIEISTNSYNYFFARFNSNGNLDQAFGSGGQVVIDRPDSNCCLFSLAIQPDGKLIATGGFFNPGNREIIRLNPNGSIDTSFGVNGFFRNDLIRNFVSVGVTADGKIIAAGLGFDTTPVGTNNGRLLRITQDGNLDTTFGQDGFVHIFAGIDRMIIQSDGKIVTSGLTVRRFLPDGTEDSSFQIRGTRVSGNLKSLPDGRLLVVQGGFLNKIYLVSKIGVIIGRITLFQLGIPVDSLSISDAAIQSNGKIVVSVTQNPNNQPPSSRVFLVRYNSITSFANRVADFDFDDKVDIGVFRPSNGVFYLLQSSAGFKFETATSPVSRILPENYTPSSIDLEYPSDLVWTSIDQSYKYFCGKPRIYSGSFGECFQWGLSTDIPVGGDYDGDGISDLTIFRDGLWHIRQSQTGRSLYINWGMAGDKLVPADYDYDGITDAAIYRPSTGVWWVLRSSDSNYMAFQFGTSEDKPVPADYDGDGRADFAVFRPSNRVWYLFQSTKGFAAAQFGLGTDRPVPGDYDGDGLTDIAVWRPSDGFWYLLQSKNGFAAVKFGMNGDVPLTTAYAAQ